MAKGGVASYRLLVENFRVPLAYHTSGPPSANAQNPNQNPDFWAQRNPARPGGAPLREGRAAGAIRSVGQGTSRAATAVTHFKRTEASGRTTLRDHDTQISITSVDTRR